MPFGCWSTAADAKNGFTESCNAGAERSAFVDAADNATLVRLLPWSKRTTVKRMWVKTFFDAQCARYVWTYAQVALRNCPMCLECELECDAAMSCEDGRCAGRKVPRPRLQVRGAEKTPGEEQQQEQQQHASYLATNVRRSSQPTVDTTTLMNRAMIATAYNNFAVRPLLALASVRQHFDAAGGGATNLARRAEELLVAADGGAATQPIGAGDVREFVENGLPVATAHLVASRLPSAKNFLSIWHTAASPTHRLQQLSDAIQTLAEDTGLSPDETHVSAAVGVDGRAQVTVGSTAIVNRFEHFVSRDSFVNPTQHSLVLASLAALQPDASVRSIRNEELQALRTLVKSLHGGSSGSGTKLPANATLAAMAAMDNFMLTFATKTLSAFDLGGEAVSAVNDFALVRKGWHGLRCDETAECAFIGDNVCWAAAVLVVASARRSAPCYPGCVISRHLARSCAAPHSVEYLSRLASEHLHVPMRLGTVKARLREC